MAHLTGPCQSSWAVLSSILRLVTTELPLAHSEVHLLERGVSCTELYGIFFSRGNNFSYLQL